VTELGHMEHIELKLCNPAGLAFDISFAGGHKITVDGREGFGGQDLGPRPMQLLLASLASQLSRLYRYGCDIHSAKDAPAGGGISY